LGIIGTAGKSQKTRCKGKVTGEEKKVTTSRKRRETTPSICPGMVAPSLEPWESYSPGSGIEFKISAAGKKGRDDDKGEKLRLQKGKEKGGEDHSLEECMIEGEGKRGS